MAIAATVACLRLTAPLLSTRPRAIVSSRVSALAAIQRSGPHLVCGLGCLDRRLLLRRRPRVVKQTQIGFVAELARAALAGDLLEDAELFEFRDEAVSRGECDGEFRGDEVDVHE